MSGFVLLLPPSEGKSTGGNPFAPDMFDYRSSNTFNFFSSLNSYRKTLIKTLHETIAESNLDDLEKLFGVKGGVLEEAIQANTEILSSPLLASMDRYSPGVMYKAMNFTGLHTGAQRRFLENAVIFSGMFGLLRPDDLIPNYRLKMDASLPGIGKISSYWKPVLSEKLNDIVKDKIVWDFLPQAHQAAWEDNGSHEKRIQAKFFKVEKDKTWKPITHHVKSLRGKMIYSIMHEGIESLEDLESWKHPDGYVIVDEATEVLEEGNLVILSLVK